MPLCLSIFSTLAISTLALNPLIFRSHPLDPVEINNIGFYNATYSESNATRCLYFAYGAYCSQSSLESWTCKWCKYIPDFQVTNVTQTDYLQAFVGYDVQYDQS